MPVKRRWSADEQDPVSTMQKAGPTNNLSFFVAGTYNGEGLVWHVQVFLGLVWKKLFTFECDYWGAVHSHFGMVTNKQTPKQVILEQAG